MTPTSWGPSPRPIRFKTKSSTAEAIARIREMPEVNPMLYNCIPVRVINQDGVWKIELMELPPDDPDREKYEKWWEHNRLPEFHDDDDDEGGLHLYTQPESL